MSNIFREGLLAGRRALITGGGTGIGLAIAREMGSLGATVLLAARNLDRIEAAAGELRAAGIAAHGYRLNIRDEAEVRALFARLAAEDRLPDILVNNAGGQFAAPALAISANGFRAVVDLNLNGTWLMSRAFAAAVAERGTGGAGDAMADRAIVNIVLSMDQGAPNYAHAAASRAAVINLTKTLALEWASLGIRVNAVAPGVIDTTGLAQYSEAEYRKSLEGLPLARIGTVDDVAPMVVLLASPAGTFITGATFYVDGGRHLVGRPTSREGADAP